MTPENFNYELFANVIVNSAPYPDVVTIAAYGKHLAEGTKPSNLLTAEVAIAFSKVRYAPYQNAVMHGLISKEHPRWLDALEDLTARLVYVKAANMVEAVRS